MEFFRDEDCQPTTGQTRKQIEHWYVCFEAFYYCRKMEMHHFSSTLSSALSFSYRNTTTTTIAKVQLHDINVTATAEWAFSMLSYAIWHVQVHLFTCNRRVGNFGALTKYLWLWLQLWRAFPSLSLSACTLPRFHFFFIFLIDRATKIIIHCEFFLPFHESWKLLSDHFLSLALFVFPRFTEWECARWLLRVVEVQRRIVLWCRRVHCTIR